MTFAASAAKSCGPRFAYEKFAIPKTCRRRSRTASGGVFGPSSSSMRPIFDRTDATCSPASAPLRLRTSSRMNQGRFFPFSASSL